MPKHRLIFSERDLSTASDEILKKVEGAESTLFDLGYTDFRVRILGDAAKLQMNGDYIEKAFAEREIIKAQLKPYFDDILLDLQERQRRDKWNKEKWDDAKVLSLAHTHDDLSDAERETTSKEFIQGYLFDVDLHYPAELHEKFKDYPPISAQEDITPEITGEYERQMQAKSGKKFKVQTKLCQTMTDKKGYSVDYRLLQSFLKLGIQVTAYNKVLQFNQSPWLALASGIERTNLQHQKIRASSY